jgi:hypothetical protein
MILAWVQADGEVCAPKKENKEGAQKKKKKKAGLG